MDDNEYSQPDDEWGDDPFADSPHVAAQQTEDEEDDETLAEQLLPPDKLSFEVTDAAGASWVVRKIVEARARQERIKEWARLEMNAARREEEFFQRRFRPSLEAWVTENLQGRKTLRLPDGALGYRRRRMTLQIEDKERVLEWCRSNLPEAVRVKEDVLKTPLNEHLKETGEVPPGCDIEPGGDEFYVR
jgi:phage host-nuclease inhibitor protein Gam